MFLITKAKATKQLDSVKHLPDVEDVDIRRVVLVGIEDVIGSKAAFP